MNRRPAGGKSSSVEQSVEAVGRSQESLSKDDGIVWKSIQRWSSILWEKCSAPFSATADGSNVRTVALMALAASLPLVYFLRKSGKLNNLFLIGRGTTKEFSSTEAFLAQFPGATRRQKWNEALRRTSEAAYERGVLLPLSTIPHLKVDNGIPFVVSKMNLTSMATKKGGQQPKNAAEKPDSLGNVDDALVLMNNFLQDYVLALNKFPVVDHHALIITREFIEQDTFLTSKDFVAFWTGVSEVNALGFFNCGTEAGASQPRKHIQFIPMKSMKAKMPKEVTESSRFDFVPVDKAIYEERQKESHSSLPGTPFKVSKFQFPHAVTVIGKNVQEMSTREAGKVLYQWYVSLVEASGFAPPTSDAPSKCKPHNVLLTRHWMMVVPRVITSYNGVEANGLAYAGLLLTRDEEQLQWLENVGSLEVLKNCAQLTQGV